MNNFRSNKIISQYDFYTLCIGAKPDLRFEFKYIFFFFMNNFWKTLHNILRKKNNIMANDDINRIFERNNRNSIDIILHLL